MSSSKLLSSLFRAAEGVLLALLVRESTDISLSRNHRLLFVRQHLPHDVIRTNADIVDKPQLQPSSLAQLRFSSDKRPIIVLSKCGACASLVSLLVFTHRSPSQTALFNPRVVEIESLTSDVAAREKVVA